jgi:hypothetical protein
MIKITRKNKGKSVIIIASILLIVFSIILAYIPFALAQANFYGVSQVIYDSSVNNPVKGVEKSYLVESDGKIKIYFYDDNAYVILKKPNGQKQMIAACDNEAYKYYCKGDVKCCYNFIPQWGGIMCTRDNNPIAMLFYNAKNSLGCPGSQMVNYQVDVKKGDTLYMFNSDWAQKHGLITFTSYSKCNSNQDCNDNNPKTEDICINPGTVDSYCSTKEIKCFKNSDCGTDSFFGNKFCSGNDVFSKYTSYQCKNAGTGNSYCSENVINKLFQNCVSGCIDGKCLTQCNDGIDNDNDGFIDRNDPGCWDDINNPNTYNPNRNDESRATINCRTNLDCNDNNPKTEDICINPGLGTSYCTNKEIKCLTNTECGIDMFFGDKFCSGNDVFSKFLYNICKNPGTGNSYCSTTVTNKLFLVCDYQCNDGKCVGEITCSKNTDCGINGFTGQMFCKEDDLYDKFVYFNCINPGQEDSFCKQTLVDKIVYECKFGCSDAKCNEDNVLPLITIISPLQGDMVASPVDFKFNVYDDSQISYCSLYINDELKKMVNSPFVGDHLFSIELDEGEYDYYVECADVYNNKGKSDVVSFSVKGEICPECVVDSDCPETISELVCRGDDVSTKILSYSCIDNKCVQDVSYELYKECQYGCVDAKCIKKTSGGGKPSDWQYPDLKDDDVLLIGNVGSFNYSFIEDQPIVFIKKSEDLSVRKQGFNFGIFFYILIVLIILLILAILIVISLK